MIKKVKTSDLVPGVFIHDYNFEFSKENIYLEKILIKDSKTISILRDWGISEVYIDTERGLDPSTQFKASPSINDTKKTLHTIAKERSVTHNEVPIHQEITTAREIKNDGIAIVAKSLKNAKFGEALPFEESYSLVNKMQDSLMRNRDTLLLLTRIRQKDEYTLYHSISVSSLMLRLCSYYKIQRDEAVNLAVGALFHDIGKAMIRSSILNKPGKLNAEEFQHMKLHVVHATHLLKSIKSLPTEVHDIALHHHERFDGSGYPDGLSGNQISFGAMLTSVCDVFDAITSARCYKQGLGTVEGLRLVYELSDTHFNNEMAHDFIRCIGVYPAGSCVRLEGDLIGIVIGSTDVIEQPIVKVIYDIRKKSKIKPFTINLARQNMSIINYIDHKKIKLSPSAIMKIISE